MAETVAQFRERQRLEEEASQRGLSEVAAVASHETIIARMEQGGQRVLGLFKQGRNEDAFDLWYAGALEGKA